MDYVISHTAGRLIQVDVAVTLSSLPITQNYVEQQYSVVYVDSSRENETSFRRSGNPGIVLTVNQLTTYHLILINLFL